MRVTHLMKGLVLVASPAIGVLASCSPDGHRSGPGGREPGAQHVDGTVESNDNSEANSEVANNEDEQVCHIRFIGKLNGDKLRQAFVDCDRWMTGADAAKGGLYRLSGIADEDIVLSTSYVVLLGPLGRGEPGKSNEVIFVKSELEFDEAQEWCLDIMQQMSPGIIPADNGAYTGGEFPVGEIVLFKHVEEKDPPRRYGLVVDRSQANEDHFGGLFTIIWRNED